MSIAQMNYLSALFYFMAGIFGALAAILYVAFDIRYIWLESKHRQKRANEYNAKTEQKAAKVAETERISENAAITGTRL